MVFLRGPFWTCSPFSISKRKKDLRQRLFRSSGCSEREQDSELKPENFRAINQIGTF